MWGREGFSSREALRNERQISRRRKPFAACLKSLEEFQYVGSFISEVLFTLVWFAFACDEVGNELKVIHNTPHSLVSSQAQAAQKDAE